MKLTSVTRRQFYTWFFVLFAYLLIQSVGFYLIPQWMGYAGKLQIFALNNPPFYSVTQAYAFIGQYGYTGREAYSVAMAFDVFFPFLYATVLSVGLRLIVESLHLSLRVQRITGKVPFVAALANWVADIFILILLNYSGKLVAIAAIASILTSLKFLVLGICVAGLLVGAVYIAASRTIRKMKLFIRAKIG